jgi:hypothetical protein
VQPCLIVGHNDNIISGVGPPCFKSGRITNDDSMQQHRSTSVVLHVSRDSTSPTKKRLQDLVDHMEYIVVC